MRSAGENDDWRTLRSAGVPLGHALLDDPAPTPDELHSALSRVLAAPLTTTQREALAGWLGALRRHWPTRYAAICRELAPSLEALVDAVEPNRYLKLRRIANAHLAQR